MPTRVVVAEDEAIIRMDLREMLQEEGYDVVAECGRGDEAVALVREHSPDVGPARHQDARHGRHLGCPRDRR
ncbi:MAG: response regulator [Microthrixaceae bacterium]